MTDTATTKKTVTIVDKAAKGINAATASVSKVVGELLVLVGTSNDLAFDIESASGKLAAIEDQIKTDTREAKADLAIRVKEDADKVLTSLLSGAKLARISVEDLRDLQNNLSEAEGDNADEIKKQVAIAVNSANKNSELVAAQLESSNAVANAEKDADNKALKLQVAFLEKSVATLEANAERELKARVDIAANTAQATINVSSAK